MKVTVVTLMGTDLPENLREKGLPWAYKVTSYDGSTMIFETGSEAAQHANHLHREHRAANGLYNDRGE